jgi:hypothetical protein
MSTENKICDCCSEPKLLDEFREHTRTFTNKNGTVRPYTYHDNYCIPCRRTYAMNWRRADTARNQAQNGKSVVPKMRTKEVQLEGMWNNKKTPKINKPRRAKRVRKDDDGTWSNNGLTQQLVAQREVLMVKANTHIAVPGSPFYLTREQKLALAEEAARKHAASRRVG